MEKTIEKIWKEGFLKEDALAAPRINNLYSRKSKHIVDNLMSTGKKNIIGIIAGAFIVLTVSVIIDSIPAGFLLFTVLMWLVFETKRQRARMKRVDQTLNTYEYIKAVDQLLKEAVSSFTKIYRIVYPAIIIGFTLGLWYSSIGRDLFIPGGSERFIIMGIPGVLLIFTLVAACLMSIFAGSIFKFDIYIVYGRILKKLEELLSEMEELRR